LDGGTVEKYFRTVAKTFRTDPSLFSTEGEPGKADTLAEMVSTSPVSRSACPSGPRTVDRRQLSPARARESASASWPDGSRGYTSAIGREV